MMSSDVCDVVLNLINQENKMFMPVRFKQHATFSMIYCAFINSAMSFTNDNKKFQQTDLSSNKFDLQVNKTKVMFNELVIPEPI